MEGIIEYFTIITSPGMIIYTILLGLVICFWIFTIIGLADLDILDIGDFDIDLDADVNMDFDLDGIEGAAQGSHGILSSILGFLHVGKVPITVILSLIILKMWILAYIYNVYLAETFLGMLPGFGIVFAIVAFLLIFFASIFLTGFSTAPMQGMYEIVTTNAHDNLLGRPCKVKTSKVTKTFGQGEVKVDDSWLLISIRCNEENIFKKGDEVTITNYNKNDDTYEVGIL